jgi:hypothetical protein
MKPPEPSGQYVVLVAVPHQACPRASDQSGRVPPGLRRLYSMRVKKGWIVAALAAWVSLVSKGAWADESPLIEMDSEIAKQYGGKLAEDFAKSLKDPQVKVEVDADKAVGLLNPGTSEGIIVVPVKNWKEDPDNKEVEKECGAGMCYLFMSQTYNPMIDGKPIDAKKLRTLKFMDGNGNEREATCLICSVRRNEGDDWRLQIYGAEKEPLIKAPIGEAGEGAKGGDLTLGVKDPKGEKAQLVFTLFGKYASSVEIGHKNQ